MTFALAGNPNCGKTTLFNTLTGGNQRIGNFPGVTVDKKTGTIRGTSYQVVDLPGIYSLRPFSQEEILTQEHLLADKPDVIINIVDGTNLERGLYLTMQLLSLEIPLVIALNMMDEVRASGAKVDIAALEEMLGAAVIPISAAKNEGIAALIAALPKAAGKERRRKMPDADWDDKVAQCIDTVAGIIAADAAARGLPSRFCAIKLIEGEKGMPDRLGLDEVQRRKIAGSVIKMERASGLDRNAALADMRYRRIESICRRCSVKPPRSKLEIRSMRIDRIVASRVFAFPLLLAMLGLIFWLTFEVLGPWLSGMLTQYLEALAGVTDRALTAWNVHPLLRSLVTGGIFPGVGAALSFLPLILVLFLFLSILEDSGYMARAAFIMDKPMGALGLSGRSFVPLLLGFGCTVPAALAARTLPAQRDRTMTILLTPYMSCSAKIPIYTALASAFFSESAAQVMLILYGGGILMGILISLVLKRCYFPGAPAPFFMELPNYRFPSVKNVALLLWEKAKDFLQRAFGVIFLASVVIWHLQTYTVHFQIAQSEEQSILAAVGGWIAPLFAPLGFGDWRPVTALIAGLTAKEAVIGTFGVLLGTGPECLPQALGQIFSPASAWGFLVFTLLYTPCIAAVTAIGRELGSAKKALGVVLFQCAAAWIAGFFAYRLTGIFL